MAVKVAFKFQIQIQIRSRVALPKNYNILTGQTKPQTQRVDPTLNSDNVWMMLLLLPPVAPAAAAAVAAYARPNYNASQLCAMSPFARGERGVA